MNIYNMIASVLGDYTMPVLIGAGSLAVLLLILFIFLHHRKRITKTVREPSPELAAYRKNLRIDMTDRDFEQFLKFIEHYDGEQVTRRKNKILSRCLSNSEKTDLKDFYVHTVVPASHVSVSKKEAFREFLVSRKIHGLDQAPAYRNQTQVKTQQMVAEMTADPISGLPEKQFTVMKNVKLKLDDRIQEYDIIVLGETGLYYMDFQSLKLSDADLQMSGPEVENTGNQMPDEHAGRNTTVLHISENNRWSLREVSDDGSVIQEKRLKNPTRQIVTRKLLFENILEEYMISVHPLVILQNDEIRIQQEGELSYAVLHPDEAAAAIRNGANVLSQSDRVMALQILQEHRMN